MITTGKALLTICWLAGLIVLLASATQHPTAMCIAALVGAVAWIGWGLVAALRDAPVVDDGHQPIETRPVFCGPSLFALCDDEPELPYLPADRRPTWDTATWGAPE